SGNIDAALAASVFHFNEIGLGDLKIELKNNNIPIRL
ncbi:MAG: imidazole glycerol phosphate synthase subunit HisF, partial [Flavobacteriaceae bacterium]|nr:imidazole glycerol phosphate synthase subunit HisF [Flavobacteriaceae bacterium]